MKVLRLPNLDIKDLAVAVLVWIFILERITIHMRGPDIIDNLIQLGIAGVFLLTLLLMRLRGISIKLDATAVFLILLLFSGTWQDIVWFSAAGIRKALSYSLGIIIYIFLINYFRERKRVGGAFYAIPMIYGLIASALGIILWIMLFFGLPTRPENVYVPKEGREYLLRGWHLGAIEPFATVYGHDIGRIKGFFFEPTRFAAFLLIPLILFFAFMLKNKSRGAFVSCLITAVAFLATVSRAGYITLLGAVIISFMARMGRGGKGATTRATNRDIRKFIVIPVIALIAVEVLLMGLVYVAENYPRADFLTVGIVDKETGEAHLLRSETFDFDYIVPKFTERPYGYGLSQTEHHGTYENDLDTNLSSAILLWPMAGGVPGLIIMAVLLIWLFMKYCIPALKSPDPLKNAVGTIFAALMINSMNVGTFMNPEFLLFTAIMVSMKENDVKK